MAGRPTGTERALIVAHNHPSGDPTPSPADQRITERLNECGELLGIRVLDHIIVAGDSFFSFAAGSNLSISGGNRKV